MSETKQISKTNLFNIIREEVEAEEKQLTATRKEPVLQRQLASLFNDFRARIEKLEKDNEGIIRVLDNLIKRATTMNEGQREVDLLELLGEDLFQELQAFDENLILEVGEEFQTDEEMAQLAAIRKARAERGFMTPDERDSVFQLQLAVAKRMKGVNAAELLLTRAKAAEKKKDLDPRALADTAELPAVDPALADTAPQPQLARRRGLEDRTMKLRKVRRENKQITTSELRQIIKEELEVVLSDEEAKELLGIDVEKEVDAVEGNEEQLSTYCVINIDIGCLVRQKEQVLNDPKDLGVVVFVAKREIEEPYVTIYWLGQQRRINYLQVEVAWYLWGGKDAIWEIIRPQNPMKNDNEFMNMGVGLFDDEYIDELLDPAEYKTYNEFVAANIVAMPDHLMMLLPYSGGESALAALQTAWMKEYWEGKKNLST